jgi:trimeric autotransporter adhesin
MKETRKRFERSIKAGLKHLPASSLWHIAGLTLFIAAAVFSGVSQVTTTAVQDTVYHADGTTASGTILVTWPAFVTAGGKTVATGKITANIGSGGQLSFSLAPNVGATPAGSYYTAVYHLDDGTVSKEYWSIPNVPSTTVAAIRSLVMPASVAVQTVSTSEINTLLGSYLPLNGGTLQGALQLHSDPVASMQAATKNYVDSTVAPIAAEATNVISSAPRATQAVQQPAGSNLAVNIFQGSYYASQFQTGSMNNGISNLMKSTNCSTSSPNGQSGCTVYVDPTYKNNENPQGYGAYIFGNNSQNMPWPMDTHVHDTRNGVTADYYENPFSKVPYQSAGQTITSAISLDFQKWPAYSGNAAGSEYVQTTDYAGGYNFDNYFGYGQPEYFFKTYYDNLYLASTNYTSGQQEAFQNLVNCHGVGDCLAMTTLVSCDGGVNTANDEGCHGGDFTVTEDPAIYKGTVAATAAVGTTVVATNGTAGWGTEGQDRQLLDTNPAVVITGSSITGYAGALPTGPSGNSAVNPPSATDSNANLPVSTMIQLCYAGANNGVGGAAGCTQGNQPTGFIPSAPNMINPAASVVTNVVASYSAASSPQTGLPAGFCTPSTLQSSNSAGACYLPPTGTACITDQEEYETVNYTYDSSSQQVTLLNLRFPHLNGLFFAHGGLCGYGVENQADVFSGDSNNNGISQVFPVEGSPNSTTFYYVSQRTNLGYTLPILGISNELNGGSTTGGGECFSLNISLTQLQGDNHTVVVASTIPFNSGADLSPVNGMTLTINTPNATYNGKYVVSWGSTVANANEFSYYLPTTPTGTVPNSGTASFCNTNYKLYPAVRVNSVLNTATNRVDGTMTTMPLPIAFASGDTVMEAHYPWISTAHDSGRGINQFLPRMYNGGALYGMSYGYLLSGRPFVGFQINNQTDQNRYLGYGGTHIQPGIGYDLGGDWYDSFVANQAPDEAVIKVGSCKPGPIGCNNAHSNFNVLLMPDNQALNYDPKKATWTFGQYYAEANNPPINSTGTVQAYNLNAINNVTAGKVGVAGAYLFNVGGAIGITNTPGNATFSNWFANYAYGFGAQNTKIIDGYLYRGATANSIDCGTGTGDTSCTFTLGVLNAGNSVNSPSVVASASVTTPTLNVGSGSTVSRMGYFTTGTITPSAIPAQSCNDQTFTVSGISATDNLGSIRPPASLGNVSMNGYASAVNTLLLHFCNATTSSVAPPAGAYTFLAMH